VGEPRSTDRNRQWIWISTVDNTPGAHSFRRTALLERIRQQPQSLPVWPEIALDRCAAQIDELAQLWREYLAQLSPAALSHKISYKNSKGESWSSTVQDILTHVVLHSSYHRGQIASLMRAGGQTPAYTDFIHAVRQGLLE